MLPLDLVGDPRAVEACYRQLGPMVLAYLRRQLPAPDAEDVLQQVFLELWRSRHLYDPARPIEAWLLGIAHKRAVDHLRRLGRSAPVNAEGGSEMAGQGEPTDFAEAFVTADAVRGALSGLPEEQRETLFLAYFADLTQPQIAQRLGIPVGTVKARSHRGLKSLARALVPEDES